MPASLDFGQVEATDRGKTVRLFFRNGTDSQQLVVMSPLSFPFAALPEEGFAVGAHQSQEIAVSFTPADGRLHLSELVMRSKDAACDVTVPLKGLGSGALGVTPSSLQFTLNKGEFETKELRLVNTRRVSLPIDIAVTPPMTFTLPEGSDIAAGGTLPVLVTARLDDWFRTGGVLTVNSTFERLEISIEVTPSSPTIEISPMPIDIPVVDLDLSSTPPGFAERVLRVRNGGTSGDADVPKLAVTDVVAANDRALNEVVVAKEPFTLLGEGESADVRVRFTPKTIGAHTFQVTVITSAGNLTLPITATAAALPACGMEVTPLDRLTLQEVPDGGLEGVVNFSNTGNTNCVVDGIRFNSWVPSGFSMSGVVKEQLQVPADTQRQITIAGPRQPDAGTIGALGYHVFQKDSEVRFIAIDAP